MSGNFKVLCLGEAQDWKGPPRSRSSAGFMGNYILQLLRASRERQWVKSQAVPNGAGSACHKFQIALLLLESLLSSLEQESLGA